MTNEAELENEIHLYPNIPWHASFGKVGVVDVDRRTDRPLTIELVAVADEERSHVLQVGDTFPVRDQTWKLDRVENPDSDQWTVVIVKVG